jgi:peptide/nickel transport system permease protein
MLPTMLGVILLVFFSSTGSGGDPGRTCSRARSATRSRSTTSAASSASDQPYWVQLGIFIKQVVTADFGASWSTNERVSHILMTRSAPR